MICLVHLFCLLLLSVLHEDGICPNRKMKLKQLESTLQQIDTFASPKVELEQYATTPHIASHMLYTIDKTFNDLSQKVVADFGCGCGVLSIGAAMLNSHVLSFDIDPDALETAKHNAEEFDIENIDFIQVDLTDIPLQVAGEGRHNGGLVDTVIMNPPFGTKNNKGIDMNFLQNALAITSNVVYSLHKTSTRDFILKKAKEWNSEAEVLAELHFDLPKTYRFHRKQSVDIDVDFLRFCKIPPHET